MGEMEEAPIQLVEIRDSKFGYNRPFSYVVKLEEERKISINYKLESIRQTGAGDNEISELLNDNMQYVLYFETTAIERPYINLESYHGNLIEYVANENENVNKNLQWAANQGITHLQDIFNQIIKTVTWLHENEVFFQGELHPQNIFFNRALKNITNVTIHIPDKEKNQYREVGNDNKKFFKVDFDHDNAETTCRKQDMVAVVGLIYFLLSFGNNLFKPQQTLQIENIYHNCTDVKNQTSNWNTDALDIKLHSNCNICSGEENKKIQICRFRRWINYLAKDWINAVLEEIFDVSEGTKYYIENTNHLRSHPLFWTINDSLNFLQRSSNYLSDSQDEKIIKFQKSNLSDANDIQPDFNNPQGNLKHFPKLREFLQLKKDGENGPNISTCEFLLRQIRNKSIHWYDKNETFLARREDAKIELEGMQFCSSQEPMERMEVFPTKYCLFWMCHYPKLLIELWSELKHELNN